MFAWPPIRPGCDNEAPRWNAVRSCGRGHPRVRGGCLGRRRRSVRRGRDTLRRWAVGCDLVPGPITTGSLATALNLTNAASIASGLCFRSAAGGRRTDQLGSTRTRVEASGAPGFRFATAAPRYEDPAPARVCVLGDAGGATVGMPSCVAKRVTKPVRNREARAAGPRLASPP
jgi:hypothetical protein